MADETRPDETAEERRKRRIEEARAKLKAAPAPDAAPVEAAASAPPAEETLEERRARRIAEARAKVKGAAGDAPPAAAAPPAEPAAGAGTKKIKGGVETKDIVGDALVDALKARFGMAIGSAIKMVGQRIVMVDAAAAHDVLRYLRDEARPGFDLLLDVTAVHRPEEDPPFEVVYQLCSTRDFGRIRIKTAIADGAPIASVTNLWPGANWLERECYDMFGIVFEGHPDLRRILLPEGWEGHPLRKEYPVEFRENQWVRDNLRIVEIPADADFTGKFEA